MSDSQYPNPTLRYPGMANPGDPTGQTVGALEARTVPQSSARATVTKDYFCPIPNTSMHRTDGTRITFINGFFSTDIKSTQDYLDTEIAEGHPFLRAATVDERRNFRMATDPVGLIRDETRATLEPEIRRQLEDQIRQEYASRGLVPRNADEEKIQGTDISEVAQERMGTGVRSGTGTIIGATSATSADVNVQEEQQQSVAQQEQQEMSDLDKLREAARRRQESANPGSTAMQRSVAGTDKTTTGIAASEQSQQ